jgi:preprotein translocase subunit YajC
MLNTLILLAEEGAKPQGGMGPDVMFLFLGLILLFFFVVVIPRSRRQQQERQALLTNMKKGDKVLTSGGIYGTLISISDKEDELVVKVDDNTRLRMVKASILRNLTNEEAALAAQQAAKQGGAKEGSTGVTTSPKT